MPAIADPLHQADAAAQGLEAQLAAGCIEFIGIDGPGERRFPLDHKGVSLGRHQRQPNRSGRRLSPRQCGQQHPTDVVGDALSPRTAQRQDRLVTVEHDRGCHRRHRPAPWTAAVGHGEAPDHGPPVEISELVVHHHALHQIAAAENGFHRCGVAGEIAPPVHDRDVRGAQFGAGPGATEGKPLHPWRQTRLRHAFG